MTLHEQIYRGWRGEYRDGFLYTALFGFNLGAFFTLICVVVAWWFA